MIIHHASMNSNFCQIDDLQYFKFTFNCFVLSREYCIFILVEDNFTSNRNYNAHFRYCDLGIEKMTPEEDRGMICGSVDMINDTKTILESFQRR